MKTRTLLRLAAASAWLLAMAPIGASFGADTSAPPEYGWWNKQQALPVQGDPTGLGLTTVPTVPAPPTVPADGLYVADDASGASAISAVRYQGGGGGTLTLALAGGTKLTGTEKLAACPLQGGFTPVQNGQWAARPGYDEKTCAVPGEANADGTAFTFQIPATFASALGDVSVVIVPAADATPFTLPFDKPTSDSFVVTAPVRSSSSGSEGFDSSAFDSGSAALAPTFGSTSPSFAAPSTPTPTAPSVSGGSGPTAAAPVIPAVGVASKSRRDQMAAVAILALIGGAFWFLANRPQRVPRLLGSVGGKAAPADAAAVAMVRTTRPRGVGRFARHRSAPPTAI